MNCQKLKKISLSCICLVILSCQKEVIPEEAPIDDLESIKAIVTDMGYDASDLYEASSTEYRVEGDIILSKKEIDNFAKMKKEDSGIAKKANFFGDHQLIKCWKVKDIRIKHFLDSGYESLLKDAIREINNVGGCFVNMYLVWDGQDTTVQFKYKWDPKDVAVGTANPPKDGWPGKKIFLYKSRIDKLSYAQKKVVIMHELLHSIGIHHTTDGYHLNGTTWNSDTSIMGYYWQKQRNLGPDDKDGMRLLYSDRNDRRCQY